MAKEVLAVPEDNLAEVIKVIRMGLGELSIPEDISEETAQALNEWCDEEEQYLKRIGETE